MTTARRHRLGLASILLVASTMFTSCSWGGPDCEESGMTYEEETALIRGAVRAAADELGLPSDELEEDYSDAKTALGKDDPSARQLEVQAIAERTETPDFSRTIAMWKDDWSLKLTHDTKGTWYFERSGIKAELGYSSEPGKDGMRNVWAEASTNCFPAAEVDEN